MSRIGRIVTVAVFALLGAAIGAYAALWYARSQNTLEYFAAIAHASAYSEIQRTAGTDASYEASLKAFAKVLERYRSNPNRALPDEMYAVDIALTNSRLAALARKRGDSSAAAGYTQLAEAECPRIGWRQCSAERIAEVAEQADRNSSWAESKRQEPL